jgi:hypothetical protein
MANLPENPATWETGIYQIEATDPVNGGAPNVATGAGMSNIPHKQLADRTVFLKRVIDEAGLGAAAVPLVTLNSAAARLTGSYRFASGDANTPASGVAGTVEVIAASASAVNQTARDSASTRTWTRFWNGSVWSAWSEIWRTTGVSEGLIAGWQRLPSGLILQWGSVSGTASGSGATNTVTATFPLTFQFNCAAIIVAGTGSSGCIHGAFATSLSQATVTAIRPAAGSQAFTAQYMALGT